MIGRKSYEDIISSPDLSKPLIDFDLLLTNPQYKKRIWMSYVNTNSFRECVNARLEQHGLFEKRFNKHFKNYIEENKKTYSKK